MARVFLIEHPRRSIDVSKAAEFGELTYVFDDDKRRCSVFRSEEYAATVLRRLHELKFNAARDYVCIAGSMISLVLGVAAAARRYGRLRLLLYSANEDQYVESQMDMGVVLEGAGDEQAVVADAAEVPRPAGEA